MADISKFDDVSKLQTYEDYIANNITEWAEILGVDRKLLIDRLYRGWSEQEIFDTNKYCNQYERRKVCDT